MPNRLTKRLSGRAVCLIALLLVIALLPLYSYGARQSVRQPAVILISLDGFRWDYLDKAPVPALKELAARGVRAKRLIPVFPSETLPNHYSIVTGTYPDVHGIVKNNFYDPAFKESFIARGAPAAEGKWWGAEPIWVTAEKQGQIAAAYFWPGSEADIQGKRSTYWKHNDWATPNSDRVRGVLSWLDLPSEKRPTFISLYIPDMDAIGHNFGPDSPEVIKALPIVDAAIGELVAGLKERKLLDQINIIVVSDHGMTTADRKNVVYLEDYVDLSKLETDARFVGTNSHIWTVAGKEDEVYRSLTKASHLTVYRKENVPADFHHSNNARIAPIVCVSEEGWTLALKRDMPNESGQKDGIGGTHGYDPRLPTMGAIFIAAGPAFKQGLVVEPFENIQIYNVMASILKLKPAPNTGDLSTVKGMLK